MIDVDAEDFTFDNTGYPPKKKCIFKSDSDMKALYSNYDSLTAGEQLALKNIDLAMSNGDVERFNSAFDLAEKYNSKNFAEKIGLKTVDEIKQMYSALEGCDDAEIIKKYQFYEYSTRHGYETEIGVHDGLNESKVSEMFGNDRYNNFSASDKSQAAELIDKLDEFINSTDSQDGTSNDTIIKNNVTGDNDIKQSTATSNDTTSDTNTKHTNTSDTDNGKTTSSESSDKATGTTESSGGEDSTTKGSNTNESGIKEDSTTSRTGTGDTNIKEDDETKRNTASDSDIKDDGTIKHSGTESSTTSRREFTVDTETEVAKKYMEASGKTADDMTDLDKALVKIAEKVAGNPKETSEMVGTLGKYDNLLKVGEKVGGAVDVICTAIYFGQAIANASKACDSGNKTEAAGIITGALTEFAVSTVGGWAITGILAPYFTGFGAAVGCAFGPVGAAIGAGVGALIAGLIGYGVAGIGGMGWNELIQGWFAGLDEASMLDAMTVVVDPVILDLNGDGEYTKQIEDDTHFDFMDDGFAEKTGWVSEEDGMLVHDLNKNGTIDDGSELFGDMTPMSNGEVSDNGFQALSDLDSNGDGIINQEDEAWSELQIWQDKNSDAVSQADELYSLEDLGIQQLNLEHTSKEMDDNGNLITKTGSYVTEDGITHAMVEVSFAIDAMDTIQSESVEVSENIADLPNLSGSGKMGTLHQAMAKNEELKNMVQEFVQTTDGARRGELIQDIVKAWADCGDVEPGSRGQYVDAEHMAIIEKFFGRVYKIIYVRPHSGNSGQTGAEIRYYHKTEEKGDNPNAGLGAKLEDIYAKLLSDVNRQLVAQTDLALPIALTILKETQSAEANAITGSEINYISGINNETTKEPEMEIDYTFAKTFFTELLKEDVDGTVKLMSEYTKFIKESETFKEYFSLESMQQTFGDSKVLLAAIGTYDNTGYYYGTNEADTINGKNTSETFFQGSGDDIIRGNNGNDTLYGQAGDDKLYGGNGKDILIGGNGNDYMDGGIGADTYIHNLGDGDDIIYNYDTSEEHSKDSLVFGEGISAEDIRITRIGTNMVLTNKKNGEKVTVQNAYGNARYFLENIVFADGTVWSKEEMEEKSVITGTEETDKMYGYAGAYGYSEDETFRAGAGDDIIKGNSGNDILYGEAGNDYLEGGVGADTYIHNIGDGDDIIYNYDTSEGRAKDRLVFGEGISADDIKITREGTNMVLTNKKTSEKITVRNAYRSEKYFLDNIEFADGTVWTKEEIKNGMSAIAGTEGNDSLNGYAGAYGYSENETYFAGAGDDIIRGNNGNDTLHGENGNDNLYGGTGNDILRGGTGSDYLEGGVGADTYVYNIGDGDDIIYNYDTSEERMKDRLVFGEGISTEDIKITREGVNEVLINQKTGEKITVRNAYGSEKYFLDNIEFADGTVWTKEDIQNGISAITGTEENDNLYGYTVAYGYSEDEIFYAGIGNDIIKGNNGNDTLYGQAGDDKLYGGNGNDILIGGSGNDYMDGGAGADTYIHNLGDGDDIIYNYDTSEEHSKDSLVFGEGISAEDIRITREGTDMVLLNTKNGEKVTVQNAYSYADGRGYLENIEFADGTIWTKEEMQETMSALIGTEENDNLYGYTVAYGYAENETFRVGGGNDIVRANNGNDTLYGEEGNDNLYGGNGNDILVGGSGNDYLDGGAGADTYVHNLGDGDDIICNYDTSEERIKDRLVFGEGISAEDIRITREGTNMVLTNTKNEEKVTVQNAYFYADRRGYLENIEFADGTIWTKEEIQNETLMITGTEGNDNLYGYTTVYGYSEDEIFLAGAGNDMVRGNIGNDNLYGEAGNDNLYGDKGNDVLVGGIGNDNLYGGAGNDTYIFNEGDGCDIIYDNDSTVGNEDILQVGTEAKNILFTRKGSNLLISLVDTEDTITINNWYQSDNNKIETINSADGYTLSHAQVDLLIQSMASFENTAGMSWSEGIRQEHADIDSITAQIWIKQVG